MKRLLIILIFIAVLSRGINVESKRTCEWVVHQPFEICYEGGQLLTIIPKEPGSISSIDLDLMHIASIHPSALANLKFKELVLYKTPLKPIKSINLKPESFDRTEAEIVYVIGINFPVTPNPFRNFKSLKTMYLKFNGFDSFPIDFFTDFPHLIDLQWIQRDSCKTISSTLFTNVNAELNSLVIKDAITHIAPSSFVRFKNLTKLVLGAAKLDRLRPDMFSGLHNLQYLDLSSCGIKSIEANTFHELSLVTLNLKHNEISDIAPEVFLKLPVSELNLEGNRLEEIPSEVFHSRGVMFLSLNNNQIKRIRAGIFQNLTHLWTLDLQNNQINHIEPGAFVGLCLKNLLLNNNSLEILHSDTFHSLSLTMVLNLRQNRLQEIPSNLFHSTRDLEMLDLSDNQIKDIRAGTFQNFSHMYSLNLSSNQINHIEPSAFVGLCLEDLLLNNNLLEVLHSDTFQDLNLKMGLNLRQNRLQEIPSNLFHSTRDLETLDLSDNQIKVIRAGTFQNFSHMYSLSLSNNQINHIEAGAFAGSHIEYLSLENNSLEVLQSDTFQGLHLKAVLSLDHNNITRIQPGALKTIWMDKESLPFITLIIKNMTNFPEELPHDWMEA